ncbi:hypothetical protein GCM10027176_56360 [Actinoallomurus bryophytorum]|uniref:Uncharacterized protein n=1 Tax=Actinoallomurus bryophytorum TaxID=1490222 RepID=A0A543C0D8_9ACTN|nr:hypothetical protein [Actinoallomurus bryophytorum]TQL90542.1 hypothetical protein FB559_7850 [Actinoallomurus bryophytorum]
MNEYNDRPADEPEPGTDDRPVAGFGWAGHNPDHHTDEHTGEHTGEQTGEHTDELEDQRTDDETPGEDEPLVGEVWNDDSAAGTGEQAGHEAGTDEAGSTDLADEERAEGTEAGRDHVGEPFGTEEPMIVTEDESPEDTTEAESAEEEPAEVAETPESVEPVAVTEPSDVAEPTADDAEPVTEPAAEPVVDGARPTNTDEFAIDYLVDPEAAERFRNRWRDVKGVFVDDPADAVRQASALSGEAVEELTAALGRLRQNLDDHWDEGKETDTERLRVALRGYGSFIDRLLTR